MSGGLRLPALWVALALVACGHPFEARDYRCAEGESPPCELIVPVQTVAERSIEPARTLDSEERVYAISAIRVAEPTDGVAPGFDLDGMDAGPNMDRTLDCDRAHADFRSAHDPQHRGVDNELATYLSVFDALLPAEHCPDSRASCIGLHLAAAIEEGTSVSLLRIRGLDDTEYDDAIAVELLAGRIDGEVRLEEGRLAPDQAFVARVVAIGYGDVFDGRLRARLPTWTIESSLEGLALPLGGVELRADLTDAGLVNGGLGGALSVDDAVAMVTAVSGLPPTEPLGFITLGAFLGTAADLTPCVGVTCVVAWEETGTPRETTDDDPSRCASISVGAALEAVPATVRVEE